MSDADLLKKNYKKIFIAGGAGLVGSNIVNYFNMHNISYEASYFKNLPNSSLYKYNKYKKYNFLNLNECLKATKNKDLVILCAVKNSNIINMKNEPDKYLNENITLRLNLLKSCRINNVKKIIWVSSSTLYQGSNKPIKENQLDLNSDPYNIYLVTGWIYRYIEKVIAFYISHYKMKISILRTTSIYGPFDNFNIKYSHVVPGLIVKFLNKKKISVWGNINVVRDFVYVEDLVKAILLLVNNNKNLILNFSSGKGVIIKKLCLILSTILKRKKFTNNRHSLSSANYRVLNNSAFNKLFKNFKRTTLYEGLKKTVTWYLENIKY
jgi:nucleoside-diphosphate-sugar epimerase